MKTYMGTVQTVTGIFFAKDTLGNTMKLSVGDQIKEGNIVFGDKSNNDKDSITISMEDDSPDITLSGASKWYESKA